MTAAASGLFTRGISQELFVLAGSFLILLAAATHLWQLDLAETFDWLATLFGPVFITTYLVLCSISVCAWLKLREVDGHVWLEVGQQAASGVATLALTFTLLGISLGIETLSRQALTPASVPAIIQDLTRHFSTAFLTTIVGLPTANLLRAMLAVRWAKIVKPGKSSERSTL